MTKFHLNGRLASRAGKTVKSLVTYLPAIELENYLSVTRVYPDLEVFYDAAKNKTNQKKVSEIQEDIQKELLNGGVGAPLSLTVVLENKPTLSVKGELGCLEYERTSTFVVGNVLLLIAILKTLGIKTPLFSSRLSSSEIKKNSIYRQMLAKDEVMLTIIFDDENGINGEQVRDMFFKYNRQHSGLHLTQFTKPDNTFPLKPVIDRLAKDLNFAKYGGVSTKSKHVKVSESYLTTEYIMFKFIIGSVAGAQAQETSIMSKDVTLASGQRVSEVLDSGYIKYIEAFIRAWLMPLNQDNKVTRTGFRLSAQIWQALSLVVYQLVIGGASIEELKRSGLILGELDYSKKATHWHNCDVMGLDSNGRLFKNSVNSTREFRNGLAKYFMDLVSNNVDC
ncbi:hypothetical protein [Photobacterium angustum]|uniref:DGQHR domain-containing protein n=1 Tax=Photobacterium angustum TaxID=661 RepID=A0A2S7VKV5_PHOAN|nr:hypothetical protein [Photobacterium angustum]PQJ62392.1 hypothetical protein BTO08_19350 [Photobacterium angustum]